MDAYENSECPIIAPDIDMILNSKPSYLEVTQIMDVQNIPEKHFQKCQDYKNSILEQELKVGKMVPLMRSTIRVVGRGRDGKTTTINSLKGLPFQPHCESTKGGKTSEVNVHDVGVALSCVDVSEQSGVQFREVVRDPYATKRSVAKQLMNTHTCKELEVDGKEIKDSCKSRSSKITKGASLGCCIYKSFIPKFNRNPRSQLHHSKSSIKSNPPHTMLKMEGKDNAGKKSELSLNNDDGKSIRFTIYDYGGQQVFRSVQNILLTRECVFIVVFNMMNLINTDKSIQKEALEHLNYWISSIKDYACKEDSDDSTDNNVKYPPVILVGTHHDKLLLSEAQNALKSIDQLLRKELHSIEDLVPLANKSHDKLIKSRQQLYNEAQNICFWPIDNSNPNDSNIQSLRNVLLESAMNDKGFNISQEVFTGVLHIMDKLTVLSTELPIVPLYSDDSNEYSVFKIMDECGFQGDDNFKLFICKEMLKDFHKFGHFIYFDQAELDGYCIIDPQWLIDMITYIVRDFKLHRFHRDFKAMALNNGESWKALLNKGILHGDLLRKLWLDREHESFLTKLMLKLGIFGQLHENCSEPSKNVYTVPTAITISSEEAMEMSLIRVRDFLGIDSQEQASKETIDLARCASCLLPFYCRLVNQLITEWSNGYDLEASPPELLPCAANLCFGREHNFSICVNEVSASLEVFCVDKKKFDVIMKYITEAIGFVNRNMYHKRLKIGMKSREVGGVIYRNTGLRKETIADSKTEEAKESSNSNYQALINFSINEKLAHLIHVNDEDMTPEELVELYYGDKEVFENEMLPELGITKKIDKSRIVKFLAKQPEPLEEKYYAILNFLNGDELVVKEEEDAIVKQLRLSYFKSTIYNGRYFDKIHSELARNEEYKIAHFAMHGGSIDTYTLSKCLKNSSLKCVFLNTCESEEAAMHITDNSCTETVVFWKSKVEDNAAKSFSEAFYEYLSMNRRRNYLKFNEAFKFAKEHIELRNFLLIDPINDIDELEWKKRERARPDLVAAGIPGFYDKSNKEKDEANPQAIIGPKDCMVMISFNNASTGKDAEELCHFLNRHGTKTFCTRVFCPNNIGNWRDYTVVGANKCKVFIALMTDGWQKSNECQYETDIVKTRLARKRVHIIPVYYSSFDYDFDEDNNHFYGTSWASYQGIPSKENDCQWKESILKLCEGALK